jgi:3-oxoacyl-[acyl-carrier protein] reductase
MNSAVSSSELSRAGGKLGQMAFTLEGKTALVTGSGRGIGRAVAERLAAAGAAVMVNDLDEAAVSETKSSLRSSGHRAEQIVGDLTDPSFPGKIVDATLEAFGSVDIIVNNAGYSWDSVIQKTTDEQFQAMLEIHIAVPFRVLRAASTYIRETAKKRSRPARKSCVRSSILPRSPVPTEIQVKPATPRENPG